LAVVLRRAGHPVGPIFRDRVTVSGGLLLQAILGGWSRCW
jgi:hypothetical protein